MFSRAIKRAVCFIILLTAISIVSANAVGASAEIISLPDGLQLTGVDPYPGIGVTGYIVNDTQINALTLAVHIEEAKAAIRSSNTDFFAEPAAAINKAGLKEYALKNGVEMRGLKIAQWEESAFFFKLPMRASSIVFKETTGEPVDESYRWMVFQPSWFADAGRDLHNAL